MGHNCCHALYSAPPDPFIQPVGVYVPESEPAAQLPVDRPTYIPPYAPGLCLLPMDYLCTRIRPETTTHR